MEIKDFWEIEVSWSRGRVDPRGGELLGQIQTFLEQSRLGGKVDRVEVADVYFLRGGSLAEGDLRRIATQLLSDPVVQEYRLGAASGGGPSGDKLPCPRATVLRKAGVMDPVEASLSDGLADLGFEGLQLRTANRYLLAGTLEDSALRALGAKVLSNPAIEDVYWDNVYWDNLGRDAEATGQDSYCPFRVGDVYAFSYREVPLEGLDGEGLLRVSREGQLSLSLEEMHAVQGAFARLGRAPSDVELETIAQTWSEHCCHKTLTAVIDHITPENPEGTRIDNLLKSTICKATEAIDAPWCLSVFSDNAGVIAFDDEYGVSFKVETHNHPSAIEPYGGAGTGIGGVVRDTMGTGLGAKPIVNTDVFCFGPPDLPLEQVPPGALHPLRVLRGVVAGVRDYGNRMGIPTASGAVYFDSRYVGNPLVFCGSVGILPRSMIEKEVVAGDRIYVVGGRTGRDGIHGATFSSVELSEHSETHSSGAVQIGNAITEKKLLDVLLEARDRRLFRAVTDCGAGGLSSAVGEMGAKVGARVALKRVPLKYEGLSYWEIWISEAQERMVLAVPPESAAELEHLAMTEDVECTHIGEFTGDGRLVLTYQDRGTDHVVCDLEMDFLHEGRPRSVKKSVYRKPRRFSQAPSSQPASSLPTESSPPPALGKTLFAVLALPNIASKEWIVRQYDHEVQGTSVLKPFQGVREDGPGDGVAFAPRLGSLRGIVVGCGMNPRYGVLDPYRMALSAVDEAVRNVVAAGGDPGHTAILDNFCWGNTERPETLGSLVEAARGCHTAAVGLGTPFISGKDSLNNEYRVHGTRAEGDKSREQSISIPPTLLISSISVVPDVRRLVSVDLKEVGSRLVLVGETHEEMGGSHYCAALGTGSGAEGASAEGGEVPDLRLPRACRIHQAIHRALQDGLALACHDLSEGGLAVAISEMAFAGEVGAEIHLERVPRDRCESDASILFSESNSRYLVEVRSDDVGALLAAFDGLPAAEIGETVKYRILRVLGLNGKPVLVESLEDLKRSWQSLGETLNTEHPSPP